MNSLDRFMEFLLSAVFLCAGLVKIFSSKRSAGDPSQGESAAEICGFAGLPYRWAALIGLFEIVAALTLLAPAAALPSFEPALLAALVLAALTVVATIYRARRGQPAAPTIALFLMALFVVAAHCL